LLEELTLAINTSERDLYIPEAKFLKRVFNSAPRTRSIVKICEGYCHFTWTDTDHWKDLLKTALEGLNDNDFDEIRPFLMLIQYMIAKPAECASATALD